VIFILTPNPASAQPLCSKKRASGGGPSSGSYTFSKLSHLRHTTTTPSFFLSPKKLPFTLRAKQIPGDLTRVLQVRHYVRHHGRRTDKGAQANKKRAASRAQKAVQGRGEFLLLWSMLITACSLSYRARKRRHPKPPTTDPRPRTPTMRAQTCHSNPYSLPRTTPSRMSRLSTQISK
jgi:hypothetical protein